MGKFEVRFYAGEDDRLASWMVVEVLMDDGQGNRCSEIVDEFPPPLRVRNRLASWLIR